ncbi:MAG TPA: DNA repair protein RecO [Caulobacteraceae bacterium]|jgi:DNA repair protein RecO (recombination protein O)
MEFEEAAFVLSARPHGESGAIVEALTEVKGKWAAHVAGGASRRMKPHLQPGARVTFAYRARVAEQLGSARVEGAGSGPSDLFDDSAALAGLASAAAVVAAALPEREPHPGVFRAFETLTLALVDEDIWPAVMVRFEAGLLADLGFGLDLSVCTVTGSTDDLAWVSPRTGRAVSAAAGEPYKDRLLTLPMFLLSAQAGLGAGDIEAGLALTGHFLQACVFNALDRPLPPPRERMIDRLRERGRL